ncbi:MULTISPECIES: hypothetical protein [Lysinibacillus]|uniref:Flagellar protein n=1 Tax=Lysinibacillus antri TaxID=2498145 RepID=A0A3S0P291_9BACI|nr:MULTISPECIES: hypothetical protein [Lysinibacillus]RUL48253.1 hypothetical protein EK386_16985 [Lysinibacillus antri]TSI11674.1 hypothetical protein FJQ64_00400 [Lysinibacillus sp. BW-2-10]
MNSKISRRLDVTEEEIFSELHHFLLRKNNRILSNDEVVEKTGVPEEMIHKWVKNGKLKQSMFPNLGAPCERCGKITNHAKICRDCTNTITGVLAQEERDKEWFNSIQNTNRRSTYHYK